MVLAGMAASSLSSKSCADLEVRLPNNSSIESAQVCSTHNSQWLQHTGKASLSNRLHVRHAQKRGYLSSQGMHNSRFLQQVVSCTKNQQKMAPSDRPQCPEQFSACSYIQNGNCRDYPKFTHERGMAIVHRSEGCILSRSHTSGFSTLASFPCRQANVPIQGLPFRLATAPLEFTRIVQEVKLVLQSRGIRVHQYLDDWLLRANTRHQCLVQTKELIQVVQDLGFVINLEKSELEPTQKIDFLGYHFDLIQGKVFPTEKKLKILEKAVQDREVISQTTPRLLMSLIGVLASLEKTIPMGRLHMHPFQWYLKTHWQYPQSLDLKILVSNLLKSYLQWWKDQKNLRKGCPLHPQEHNTLIFTDASNQGWGAHLENMTVSGNWTDQEKLLHINVLELKAVFLALKSFQNKILDKRVLIATDNATVVSYLNKQGGTHSWDMCLLVWRILAYCNPQNILIRARHIQGCLNVIADSLSRKDKIIQTEWSLHPQIFSIIYKVWHTPMVDMFATKFNHKLPIYVSPVPDANAMNIDALNISWEGLDGYAFCPVVLIPKVIQKMNTYRCRMIVVAPGWPMMHWFWDLVNLSTKPPLQLPHWPHLLKQPFSHKFHQNLMYLNLHVWHLDTTQNHLNHSLSRWHIELRHLKDPHLEDFMSQGGPFLNSGANRTRIFEPSVYCQNFEACHKPAGYRIAIADHLGPFGQEVGKSMHLCT